MNQASQYYINADTARDLCIKILAATGAGEDNAALVVDNLIQAELRGISSHGLSRMMVYCTRLENGQINVKPDIKIISETSGTLLMDADNSLGQVAGVKAMDLCLDKALSSGISACSVRNGSHFGIAAYYAMRAVPRDMIGITLTNAPATMAPWGSITAMLGTNPLCFAIPAGARKPVVFDSATSVVARGKVILADKENRPIPEGWAMDKLGRPTTDAAEALLGSVLPFGGYKGSGISIVIDILCALLSGASFGKHIGELYNNTSTYQDLGFFFAAINIASFCDPAAFKKRMDQMIDEIKGSEKAYGVEEIFVPGEIEFNNETEVRRRGVEIGPGVLGDLKKLSEKFGIGIDPYTLVTRLE